MRKLASIQRVTDIRPIEGRDRIEQCHVNGWNVIVKKGEFAEGDLCCYVEIDSQMPEKPEYEFLRQKKFRIRTMKMAGVLSEGICFPLTILPAREKPYELDEDVTALMGVTKWEPQEDEQWWKDMKAAPVQLTFWEKLPLMRFKWYRRIFGKRRKAGGFPDFIPVTDETRIQNMPFILEDKKTKWLLTEKIDGTSGTFVLLRHKRFLLPDTFEFIVCSRKMRLAKDMKSHYWQVAERYWIEYVLRCLIGDEDWVAIQGEIIGPKIQKNKYKASCPDLYVFNLLWPNIGSRAWRRQDSVSAAYRLKQFGMKFVPIVDTDVVLPDTVDEVLALAHGQSRIGDTLREGLVFRSMDGQQSFKAVDPEFLIHYGI